MAELELVLREHPFKRVADAHGCAVDYHGLAQHYGIPTSLLDLTSNIEVAAFFAVAQWERSAQRWTPAVEGSGVLYRLDWTAFGPGYSRFFDPVGFGPGLRPARQHAWTFRPRPHTDFLRTPHLTAFEFEHSAEASAQIFAQFDSGARLYPPDCMAPLVEKVRNLPIVTMAAIRHAAAQDGIPTTDLDATAERAAAFLSGNLPIDVLDGHELQLEEADVAAAESQAIALDKALKNTLACFSVIATRKGV